MKKAEKQGVSLAGAGDALFRFLGGYTGAGGKCRRPEKLTKEDFDMKISRIEHMCEGNGHVIIKELLDEQQLNGKCGLYAEVTLEPGCSLGFHMHYGESETYYIITGEGEYNDNGTSWRHVKAGDITFTSDGRGHGLANTGNTDLVFMALIIKD